MLVTFTHRPSMLRQAQILLLCLLPLLWQCRGATFQAKKPNNAAAINGGNGDAIGDNPGGTGNGDDSPGANDPPEEGGDNNPPEETTPSSSPSPKPSPDGAPSGEPTASPLPTPGSSPSPSPKPTMSPSPSPSPSPTIDIAKLCKENAKVYAEDLSFPDFKKSCPWNMGDNLDKDDGYIQARNELTLKPTLPAGAVICSAKFKINNQAFWYDDQFAIMINNIVVVQSQDYPSLKTKAGNKYPVYKWLDIRNQKFKSAGYEPMCAGVVAGTAACKIPKSKYDSCFEVELPEPVVTEVLGLGGVVTEATYKDLKDKGVSPSYTVAVFGDNDYWSDCRMSDIKLHTEFKYVQPGSPQPGPTASPSPESSPSPSPSPTASE